MGRNMITDTYFKLPDNWVDAGRETYCNKDGEPVFIGLDFGTCFTKAAVRLHDQLHVVTWEGVTQFPKNYLLPSEVSYINGDFVLGKTQRFRTNLKTGLFYKKFKKDSVEAGAVCIFLALVLRYIRAWVYRHLGKHFRSRKIKWGGNVGLPAEVLEFSVMTKTYETITRTAGLMSQEKIIDWHKVMDYLQKISPSEIDRFLPLDAIKLDFCEAKPEFVAQLAGYIQSPQRQNGLHLLVDIGGGTLDVVSFIIWEANQDSDDEYNILWPSVTRNGTQALNDYRCRGTKVVADIFQHVLDATSFATQYRLPPFEIRKRDSEFQEHIRRRIFKVLHMTKQKRYIRAPEWQNGLKVFISGGGSHVGLYRNASLDAANGKTKQSSQLVDLPVHPDLMDFNDFRNYSRVSVACGLAQDPFNFGIIRNAKDITDDDDLNTQEKFESVTKDMV